MPVTEQLQVAGPWPAWFMLLQLLTQSHGTATHADLLAAASVRGSATASSYAGVAANVVSVLLCAYTTGSERLWPALPELW